MQTNEQARAMEVARKIAPVAVRMERGIGMTIDLLAVAKVIETALAERDAVIAAAREVALAACRLNIATDGQDAIRDERLRMLNALIAWETILTSHRSDDNV